MKKMNVIQCVNGHFYDGQKYDFCPHCGATAKKDGGEPSVPIVKNEPKSKNSIFGKLKKTAAKSKAPSETYGVFDDEEHASASVYDIPKTSQTKEDALAPNVSENKEPPTRKEQSRRVHFESNQTESENVFGDDVPTTDNQRAIESIGNNDGKTFGFFHIEEDVSEESNNFVSEPVVGWIVCVSGKHLGESFNVFAGRNSIGRGNNNLIVISKDPQISREKHAFITYEPKKRVFYIASGDSSGLTYLNEEMVDSSVQLNYLDTIEMGKSQFVFVPLCGDRFSWDNYI